DFDTPDRFLQRQRIGLRVRKEAGRWVQTMKAGGSVRAGMHQRHEWESEVDAPQPDLAVLRKLAGKDADAASALALPNLAEQLQEQFVVRVRRATWKLAYENAEIELALDEGTIERGELKVPVSEMELELKSGPPAALYDVALKLLADVPARIGSRSKAERGFALGADIKPEAVKAQPVHLAKDMTVERAMQAVFENCLDQIAANEAGVAETTAPEPLHQMRVGLRRLRSALKLFADAATLPSHLQDDLQWLAGELGGARDWDVLALTTLPRLQQAPQEAFPMQALQHWVGEIAAGKHNAAARAVQSPRFTRFVLALVAWVQGAGWQEDLDDARAHRLNEPVRRFANHTLQDDHKRVLKRGKKIEDADAESLHRLRIAIKRCRYAAEYFGNLYGGKQVRRYTEALTGLQDELGWRNDVAVAQNLLRDVEHRHGDASADIAFARGYLAAEAAFDRRGLVKAWKAFRKQTQPWHHH
ncbi:CHAD domain-containing protein, partial [Oxalobacteraceae bacterium OM1]